MFSKIQFHPRSYFLKEPTLLYNLVKTLIFEFKIISTDNRARMRERASSESATRVLNTWNELIVFFLRFSQ